MSPFALHTQLEKDSIFVRNLLLSQLRLQNQKLVPWLILVPRRGDIKEIHELNQEDRILLMEEIAQASKALMALYAPDKINVGALGNIVPQLHIHIIGRFKNDPAWPAPVWGKLPNKPYTADAVEIIKTKLNATSFCN